MDFISIQVKLKPDGTVLKKTEAFFKKHFPDLDYSSVYDVDGYNKDGEFIYQFGYVSYGDIEFYNDDCELIEEGTKEYEIEALNNDILLLGFYVLISEIEDKNELAKYGLTNHFTIQDGSQFGYMKKTEFAKRDLAQAQKELAELLKDQSPL